MSDEDKEAKIIFDSTMIQLRQKAEEVISKQASLSAENLENSLILDANQILHNLQVHQIELEMQNEQLLQAQRELELQKERYLKLFDFAPVAYFTLDDQQKIIDCNLASENLLGLNKLSLKSNSFTNFISKEHQDLFYFYIKDLKNTNKSLATEMQMVMNNGSIFWGRLEACITTDFANAPIFRIIVSDVTKREKILMQKNDELKSAHDELESFNYTASHDLRSPLQTIGSYIQIILKNHPQCINREINEIFNRIINATKRMGSVLDGLVILSHISQMELKLEDINLSPIALEIANELKLNAPDRHIEFIIPKNIMAFGDARLLIILLSNLLNNACKFSSKKEKAIIEFGLVNDAQASPITYFISDNGAGFDMRHSDKLFKPFERLHANSEFSGTGIGLASIKRVINRHSGKIWGEGTPNIGATFYFTLPTNK